jgi:RNA polymerase sigma factor (sigma-70 family)
MGRCRVAAQHGGVTRTTDAPRAAWPHLSPEAERRLVAAAAAGAPHACDRLVEAFWPAIRNAARVYRGVPAVNDAELMQEGVVGLLRALARFDPELGTPFWGYASWWVRQAMQQLVAELRRPIVLSDRALRRLARVRDARRAFAQDHRREPTIQDLVVATGIARRHIESLLAAERPTRGLDEHPGSGDDDSAPSLGDQLADPGAQDAYEHVADLSEIETVRDLPDALSARERGILRAHYGFDGPPMTLREIAGGLDVSAERVRQIEERALDTLRAAVASR